MKGFLSFLLILFLFSGCSKEEDSLKIYNEGVPFSVSVISQDVEGDMSFYQIDLLGGEVQPSLAVNISNGLILNQETYINNIYEDVIVFKTDEESDSDITIYNVKSGSSNSVSNYLNTIGAPEDVSFFRVSGSSSTLLTFYHNTVIESETYELKVHIGKYDFKTDTYQEFITAESSSNGLNTGVVIGQGATSTGIVSSDKYMLVKYEDWSAMDRDERKYVLDIYETNSLKKIKTFESESIFGCFQDGNSLMFFKNDGEPGGYNELYNFINGNSKIFQKTDGALTLSIDAVGHTKIEGNKVGMSLFSPLGYEPFIMDFNSNKYRHIGENYLSGSLDFIYDRVVAWDIELQNEIAVVAYSKRNTNLTEKEYEIAFVNFEGEVLYKTNLPGYLPKNIIIH
ncbi:hypothetical protein [Flagellimonas marina]|uniref:TolB-like 6-blade propeller-like n=1 Tax=Flagellimonas marina TaxID=1775168 RepID=A0ABV8PMH7_9FLAO